MCSQKPVFFPLGINKGLVRLNLAENMVGCDFLGADPKILIQNDYKTRFLMEVSCFCSFFFDNFAWICTILAIQNQLFSNEKHTTMFQISAKGWFLWFFKSSKASGVSIKGFDSSKGTYHEMSWHQVWEKVVVFLHSKEKRPYCLRKNVFLITNKTCFWKIPKKLWVLDTLYLLSIYLYMYLFIALSIIFIYFSINPSIYIYLFIYLLFIFVFVYL